MMEKQMKELAWNTFKQTGNIDTFMELKKVENIQQNSMQNQFTDINKNVIQDSISGEIDGTLK